MCIHNTIVIEFYFIQAFFKVCECLTYLVRSDTFITVDNFSMCVHSVRHFIEIASSRQSLDHDRRHGKSTPSKRRERVPSPTRGTSKSPKIESPEASGSNSSTYGTASLRLLDLLDALYSKVGRIFDKETVARLQSDWSSFVSRASATERANEELESGDAAAKVYSPEADIDRSSRGDGCSILWHVAWCPILQGEIDGYFGGLTVLPSTMFDQPL